MEPERWHRIEQLYHSALKVAAEQRAVFLKDECQDDEEVRKEVESLLSYESSAAEFIESPAFDVAARLIAEDKAAEETPKTRLWTRFRALPRSERKNSCKSRHLLRKPSQCQSEQPCLAFGCWGS